MYLHIEKLYFNYFGFQNLLYILAIQKKKINNITNNLNLYLK